MPRQPNISLIPAAFIAVALALFLVLLAVTLAEIASQRGYEPLQAAESVG